MGLSLGKWRRLQQATCRRGTFAVLAIDHRGPLRQALVREDASMDADQALVSLKRDVVRELSPDATAVLLDPETGLAPCIARSDLAGTTGLIVALDTGSTGDPMTLRTGLVEDWDVQRTVAVGAAGAKLLVYYHPDDRNATRTEDLVRTIGLACAEHDLPLYLEPLSYAPDQPGHALASDARRQVVIETARRLVPLGVDVLKAEFPLNVADEPDRNVWREACQELTAASAVPWVLLSAGVSYEVFLQQTRVACQAGASGIMAGRAVWSEAVTADRPARVEFLRTTARERMARLAALSTALAVPFSARLDPPSEGRP